VGKFKVLVKDRGFKLVGILSCGRVKNMERYLYGEVLFRSGFKTGCLIFRDFSAPVFKLNSKYFVAGGVVLSFKEIEKKWVEGGNLPKFFDMGIGGSISCVKRMGGGGMLSKKMLKTILSVRRNNMDRIRSVFLGDRRIFKAIKNFPPNMDFKSVEDFVERLILNISV